MLRTIVVPRNLIVFKEGEHLVSAFQHPNTVFFRNFTPSRVPFDLPEERVDGSFVLP
jgi:hypothetical protein